MREMILLLNYGNLHFHSYQHSYRNPAQTGQDFFIKEEFKMSTLTALIASALMVVGMQVPTLISSAECTPQYELSDRMYLPADHYASIESCWESWDENQKDFLIQLCEQYDLDYRIMAGVIYNESNFYPDVIGENTNGTRDWGLCQINDVCFDYVSQYVEIDSMSDLLDPYKNIEAGCVLMNYHKQATNDDALALLRYQVGEGSYARMISAGQYSSATQVQVLEFSKRIF